VRFSITAGSLSITHNAVSLIMPKAGNQSCFDGDAAEFVSLGGGSWRCLFFTCGQDRPRGSAGSFLSPTGVTTLTSAHADTVIFVGGASAYTITLPVASTVATGASIKFKGYTVGTFGVTISRAGTDSIYGGQGAASISTMLYGADTLELTSNGATGWHITAGAHRFESNWTATLPASAVAVSVAHGLASNPRSTCIVAECTTADAGYAIGDRIKPWSASAAYVAPDPTWSNATNVGTTAASGASNWFFVHKTTGVYTALVTASWKYRFVAEA
jgi:hypothetical protein